jgi:hypothetical protein
MSRPHFELTVTLPRDARFADTARELAVHAAKDDGVPPEKAAAFGNEVADVLRGYLETGGDSVPVVLRRTSGPVEVLINGRTLTPDP